MDARHLKNPVDILRAALSQAFGPNAIMFALAAIPGVAIW